MTRKFVWPSTNVTTKLASLVCKKILKKKTEKKAKLKTEVYNFAGKIVGCFSCWAVYHHRMTRKFVWPSTNVITKLAWFQITIGP